MLSLRSTTLALLPLIGVSCGMASTSVAGLVDPAFETSTFDGLLVEVSSDDLRVRKAAESWFVYEAARLGIRAVPAIDVILPTRQYSGEELASIIAEHDLEATLLVSLTDSYTSQSYVPGTSYTTGSVNTYGSYSTVSATTYSTPGYTISKPRRKHTLSLIELENWNTAWTASSHTAGNAFADGDDLYQALAEETLREILNTGLLASHPDIAEKFAQAQKERREEARANSPFAID